MTPIQTETPIDRDPPDRDPQTETPRQRPPDRDPQTETSGKRPVGHAPCVACWDRDPPPVNRMTDKQA